MILASSFARCAPEPRSRPSSPSLAHLAVIAARSGKIPLYFYAPGSIMLPGGRSGSRSSQHGWRTNVRRCSEPRFEHVRGCTIRYSGIDTSLRRGTVTVLRPSAATVPREPSPALFALIRGQVIDAVLAGRPEVGGAAMMPNVWWQPFVALLRGRQSVPTSTHPFHAVSVVPGAQACQAVYVFTGQRFLSRNAPRLPVAGCNSRFCTCKFKHHKDRRAGPRRRSDFGFGPALWHGVERRKRHGRRTEDF